MKTALKKIVGTALIQLGNSWPASKPYLKSYGFRASDSFLSLSRALKVQTPAGHTLKLTNVCDNYLSLKVFWKGTGYYEPISTLVVQELLQPDATFIDVGANIGFYSLLMSLTKPRIKVIAFEPNPKNFRILNENVAANGFKNIRPELLAVSDSIETATLYLNGSDMSASLLPDFQGFNPATDSIQIQTTTLDRYFENYATSGPLVLKIDVEGHEVAALRGARRLLEERAPDVILEVLTPYPDEVNELFQNFGYKFYQITDEGLLPSDRLVPVQHGELCFLNYLICKRSKAELQPISEKIVAMVKHLDLFDTSKYFGPEIPAAESIFDRIARFVTAPA